MQRKSSVGKWNRLLRIIVLLMTGDGSFPDTSLPKTADFETGF
jgi:hypothetical protein